jgi:hypothetical protein
VKPNSVEQKNFFDGNAQERPHRLSRGDKLGMLDRIVLPKVKGASPGSLLHMLRVIDSFCGNYRHCVVKRGTLAERARLSLRQAQRLLNGLMRIGVVNVEHLSNREGYRTASRYLPDWEAIAKLDPSPKCHGGTQVEGNQSATVALRSPHPECHPVLPECHPVLPECHRGTALVPSSDPSIDPPPPKSPNRIAGFSRGGSEAEVERFFLKAGDVRDVRSRLKAYRRIVDQPAIDLQRDVDSLAAFLCLLDATDRDARARAGTGGQFHDWVAVANARLQKPRVQWRGWFTPTESQRAQQQAEAFVRANPQVWAEFVQASEVKK